MSSTGGLCCFICLLLSIIRHVNGVIINGPLNAVVEVGQQATFNCTSNISLQIWVLTTKREDVGTDKAQGIALNCVVQPGFTTHYEIDRPGGNTSICNLIVKDTTMQQAGIYTCTDIASGPSAILTVIENSPVITYNNLTVEKENVTIECSMNYTGSMPPAPTLRPYFYWRNSSVQNISSSYDSTTESKAVSRVMVTAARENITPYTCHVYLQLLPPRNAGYANNTPFVSGIASSTTIEVFYEPSTPNISQEIKNFTANDGSICTLTKLTCTSTANPPPNYTWKDVTSGGALMIGVSGSVFEFAEDNRTYECTAINNISNLNKSSSATSTVGISSSRPCVSVKSNDIRICSDDGLCDNGATSRSCSNGSHIYLTSNVSNVYPRPTQFQWKDGSGNVLSDTFANNATINGDYNVLVYNEINQQSNTPAVAMVQVTDCCAKWKLIVSVIIPWIGVCLIATIIFIVCYASLATPFRAKMLSRFSWLEYMLPCINNPKVGPQRGDESAESSVKSSGIALPSEQLNKKKRRKEKKITDTLDSSTTHSPHSNDKRSTTATARRPLPPKPTKLNPIKNKAQTKTQGSESAKPIASENKKTGKDIGERIGPPRWKIFGFVILLVVVSLTCGILFFPILITIAYCCPKVVEDNDGQMVNRSPKKGKPIYFIPLFLLLWFGVVALMFPLTFVLVYFITCEQMTFRYVVTR